MVEFKENAIVLTISTTTPLQDWVEIQKAFIQASYFIMNNSDMSPSDYNLFWFNEVQHALSKVNIVPSHEREIIKILSSKTKSITP